MLLGVKGIFYCLGSKFYSSSVIFFTINGRTEQNSIATVEFVDLKKAFDKVPNKSFGEIEKKRRSRNP